MKKINEILEDSKYLKRPLLIKDHFDDSFISQDDIYDLLKNISEDSENHKHSSVRVYVNGGLNPEFEDQVKFSTISNFSSIHEWATNVFQKKRYGIIVNRAERWNERVALKIQQFMDPFLLEKDGRYELEITLFIGDYGYTPFGFHIDDEDTSVIHFHLGPGKKDMYLLEKACFNQEKSGQANRCFNHDKLKSLSEKFIIEERDLFVLPSHLYHLGNTPEFSVGLALAIIDKTKESRMKDAIRDNFDKFMTFNSNAILSDFKQFINQRQAFLRKSNGYYQLPPLSLSDTLSGNYTCIWSSGYYPIICNRDGDFFYIYARGSEIKMKYNLHVEKLLEYISTVHELTIPELIEYFKDTIKEEVIVRIIHILVDLRALYVK